MLNLCLQFLKKQKNGFKCQGKWEILYAFGMFQGFSSLQLLNRL